MLVVVASVLTAAEQMACLAAKYMVSQVFGMADKDTSELGGEGVAVCPKGFISWVFTPVLRECGVMVEGGCHFFFSDQGPLLKAAVMWEGSIRAKEPLSFLFVCLEAEMSLRAMRPTSSDAKLMGGGCT